MAKRVLANKNVLGSSVSHSSLSPENREFKTARDLLMDLKCAGIHMLYLIRGLQGFFSRYHLSNLPRDEEKKSNKYKLDYDLNVGQCFY